MQKSSKQSYYTLPSENENNMHGLAEIIITKNRNGKTGRIRLKFNQVYVSNLL